MTGRLLTCERCERSVRVFVEATVFCGCGREMTPPPAYESKEKRPREQLHFLRNESKTKAEPDKAPPGVPVAARD